MNQTTDYISWLLILLSNITECKGSVDSNCKITDNFDSRRQSINRNACNANLIFQVCSSFLVHDGPCGEEANTSPILFCWVRSNFQKGIYFFNLCTVQFLNDSGYLRVLQNRIKIKHYSKWINKMDSWPFDRKTSTTSAAGACSRDENQNCAWILLAGETDPFLLPFEQRLL